MKFVTRRTFSFLVVFCLLPTGSIFAQVDYYREVQPLFDYYCTSCHGNIGGVDLGSYEATMASEGELYEKSIVIPGDPNASPLVDKIESRPDYGSRMPLNRKPLSSEQIALIRQWIEEGAAVESSSETGGLVVDKTDHFKLLKNFPNPFKRQTTFRIWSDRPAEYTIKIFDIQGRLLKNIGGQISVGATHILVEMNNQSSGMYLYKITLNSLDIDSITLTGNMVLSG